MRVDNHVLGGASDEVLSVLAVRKAVYEDDGIFTCQVVDTELASLRRIDGPENEIPPFGFSGSQSLELEVLRPPLIEVYPRSLTLFKVSQKHRWQARGVLGEVTHLFWPMSIRKKILKFYYFLTLSLRFFSFSQFPSNTV